MREDAMYKVAQGWYQGKGVPENWRPEKKNSLKLVSPQHLSLGTKEQRRFQDPDAGGRRKMLCTRRPKGGITAHQTPAKKKSKIVQT
jgi:hypothetical protein